MPQADRQDVCGACIRPTRLRPPVIEKALRLVGIERAVALKEVARLRRILGDRALQTHTRAPRIDQLRRRADRRRALEVVAPRQASDVPYAVRRQRVTIYVVNEPVPRWMQLGLDPPRVNRQETDHIARLLMAVDPDVCVANDQRAPRDVAEEVRRRLKFIGCNAEQSCERMLAELALAGRRLLIEVDRERRDRRRDAVHACIDRRQPHRLLGRRLDAGPGGYRLVDDAAELAAIIAATTLPRPPHAISLRTSRG